MQTLSELSKEEKKARSQLRSWSNRNAIIIGIDLNVEHLLTQIDRELSLKVSLSEGQQTARQLSPAEHFERQTMRKKKFNGCNRSLTHSSARRVQRADDLKVLWHFGSLKSADDCSSIKAKEPRKRSEAKRLE
jgi:hypothetical protein